VHLAGISRHATEGAHAALVLDQAGWHTSPKLRVPESISLLPLPPCVPEPNQVEQVWARLAKGSGRRSRMEWQDKGYLRANLLNHRVWNNYGGTVGACCNLRNTHDKHAPNASPPLPVAPGSEQSVDRASGIRQETMVGVGREQTIRFRSPERSKPTFVVARRAAAPDRGCGKTWPLGSMTNDIVATKRQHVRRICTTLPVNNKDAHYRHGTMF